MKINRSYNDSVLSKILNWLVVGSKDNLFSNSKFLKIFSRLNNEKLSIIFTSLSLLCVWYESLFTRLGIGWVEGMNFGVIFLFLAFIFCDKRRFRSTRSVIYLLLFVFSLLASGLLAAFNGLQVGMLFTGILLFGQFVLAFLVASTFKSKQVFLKIILLLSLPLILVGIFQLFWGEATSRLWFSGAENLVGVRVFGFFGSPNVMGSLFMITAIVSLFIWFEKKRWYYLVYGILALAVLVMTFSRSAWLGFFVGLVFALLIKNWRLAVLTPLGLLGLIIPSIRQRLLVAVSQEYLVDAALDGRTWSFNNAIEIAKTSPILGTGPGTYGGQTAIYYDSPVYLNGMQNGYIALPYTDNQWLQVFVQTGFVGLIFIIGFFVSHIVNNLKSYKMTGSCLNLGVIAVTVAVIVNGFFANIWEFGAISIVCGAYLGLGNNYESR